MALNLAESTRSFPKPFHVSLHPIGVPLNPVTLLIATFCLSVLPAYAQNPGPQDFKDRFTDYSVVAFGPPALLTPVFPATIRMLNPSIAYPREWRQGIAGFGRNYGHAMAEQTSLATARFATGAILREDFRYRPSASRNPLVRGFHAAGFAFVDRSDSGHPRPALANFAGAAASGFVGNAWLPTGFNDVTHAESRAAVAFGGIVGRYLLQEFKPELLRIGKKLHLSGGSGRQIPEWWTKR